MRELLQQALEALQNYRINSDGVNDDCERFQKTELETAIEAALSRSKWVKVSDGLPVVPEGYRKVDIWAHTITGEIQKTTFWTGETKNNFSHSYTHWQYRQDDTPAPPEAE